MTDGSRISRRKLEEACYRFQHALWKCCVVTQPCKSVSASGRCTWEDHDLVLCTRNGRPISQRNAHRSSTRILGQAGVEHRGVHHMRHAHVTMLAERGVHERVAQQLAGHADSRITREVYMHVTRRMLDVAAEAIDEAIEELHHRDAREEMGPQLGPSGLQQDAEEA